MSLIEVVNPASGELLGEVADFGEQGVDEAVAAAREAEWRKVPAVDREALLWRMAKLVERDAGDLALLSSLESGRTVDTVRRWDVGGAIDALRYYGGGVRRYTGEPVGVVGAILSAQEPARLAATAIGLALSKGNTIVVKPAEATPYSALRLMQLAEEAGIEPGVIQVATGRGRTTGDALARHMGVAALLFAGSERNARRVLIAAAESNLKAVEMAVRRRRAQVVFGGAELKQVVRSVIAGAFVDQRGWNELWVETTMHGQLMEWILRKVRGLRMEEVGAQVEAERVMRLLSECGGEVVHGGSRSGGYVEPTVVSGGEGEVEGPVLRVVRFEDEEDLVARLVARDVVVWSDRERRVAAERVWVNCEETLESARPWSEQFGGKVKAVWRSN